MVNHDEIKAIVKGYDNHSLCLGTLGGHSALDICRGAKKFALRNVVICVKGREKTYEHYYKVRRNKGIVDQVILVDSFNDILKPEIQEQLRKLNTIFVNSRYFWTYCDYKKIEEEFKVPILGNRYLIRAEQREEKNNQYDILRAAGIRIPRIFKSQQEIDRLVIVKVNDAVRTYERAFFFASSPMEFEKKAAELLNARKITKEALQTAVIEEAILGAQVNLNFFYSVALGELEFMGADIRRQTNLDGVLRLPAPQQMEVLAKTQPTLIENSHMVVTLKESLLEKVFEAGEKFVAAVRQMQPLGMIGPFALQGAFVTENNKEEFVVFDVSLRMPGSPGIMFSPYTSYLWPTQLSYGERIGMEIKVSREREILDQIVT